MKDKSSLKFNSEEIYQIIFSGLSDIDKLKLVNEIHDLKTKEITISNLAQSLKEWFQQKAVKIIASIQDNISEHISIYGTGGGPSQIGESYGPTTGRDGINRLYWLLYRESLKYINYKELATIINNKIVTLKKKKVDENQLKIFDTKPHDDVKFSWSKENYVFSKDWFNKNLDLTKLTKEIIKNPFDIVQSIQGSYHASDNMGGCFANEELAKIYGDWYTSLLNIMFLRESVRVKDIGSFLRNYSDNVIFKAALEICDSNEREKAISEKRYVTDFVIINALIVGIANYYYQEPIKQLNKNLNDIFSKSDDQIFEVFARMINNSEHYDLITGGIMVKIYTPKEFVDEYNSSDCNDSDWSDFVKSSHYDDFLILHDYSELENSLNKHFTIAEIIDDYDDYDGYLYFPY